MKLSVVAMMLFLLNASARAQDDEGKCSGSTAEMRSCLSGIYHKLDARLRLLYESRMKDIVHMSEYSPDDIADLKEAQRLWIAYRKVHCRFESTRYKGGSAAALAELGCMIRLTRQRISDFQAAF